MDEDGPSLFVFCFTSTDLCSSSRVAVQGAQKRTLDVHSKHTVLESHVFVSDWSLVGFKAYFLV